MVVRVRLRVDPIKCKAHGMCGELFPERIRMDDWGYPVIDPRALSDDVLEHARRAVAECPRSALRVDLMDDPSARNRPDDPD
jgi:ferredoxin